MVRVAEGIICDNVMDKLHNINCIESIIMTLYQQIKSDQLAARKMQSSSAAFLTTLLSEVAKIGKDNGNREPTDAECIATIKKFIANSDLILSHVPDNKATMEEKELALSYLPVQLSEVQLKSIVTEFDNLGKFMGHLKMKYAGLYDGALAKKVFDAKSS